MTLSISREPSRGAWIDFVAVPPPIVPPGWHTCRLDTSVALCEACAFVGMTLEEARSGKQRRDLAYRRGYAALILAQRGWSTTQIGAAFGVDHSAISYIARRVTFLRGLD